jgi:hypothetical protein
LLPGAIISGLSSYQVSKDELQAKPFKYYPVGVIMKNGNKYIMDGTKQVETTFTIPEGRNIVYMKYRETKDNIQWVHKIVNRMKSNIDSDEFIEMCDLISRHKKRGDIPLL